MLTRPDRVTPAPQARMLGRAARWPSRVPAGAKSVSSIRVTQVCSPPFSGPLIRVEEGNRVMTARTYESLASAATRMGVSVKTVRRRIAEGVLPVYRCGRILRLDPNDVDGMLFQSQSPAAVPHGSMARRPARRTG